ncbi:DUF732 domain-containing protein [Mycobacterium goodii]|uniref:DUF732 domain-containing protein n=1 Tax=Mycolicibacterium goodii TaxID=134601 RepID=A0A0K0XGP7_MYCGD|nr:hypothetical protein AFA91_21495 [Mycolicibacterium goodii]
MAGVMAATAIGVAPAHADPADPAVPGIPVDPAVPGAPTDQAFVDALGQAGVNAVDPAQAAAMGQAVCPMLAEQGQSAADVASNVADTGGMPLGPATMFTGIAVSMFCPAMVAKLSQGVPPDLPMNVPWPMFGF